MLRRGIVGLIVAVAFGSLATAEEFTGTITKIEGNSITVRKMAFGGFGGKKKTDDAPAPEEKTFKVSGDVKVIRIKGKGDTKEEVKLTYDELKVAVKVTNLTVTVTYDGDKASEIKTGGGGFGGGGKKKTKKKDE